MMTYLRRILALLIGAFAFTFAFQANMVVKAADQPNVMFMGEDADEDTVPRNSRIFNRVNDALRSEMQKKGFEVYSETATTMDVTNPNRVRRTDAELIATAKAVTETPIDVIVTFQIYASDQKNAYADVHQLRIRVVGRLLQVQTGKDLGNYEVTLGPKGLKPLPPGCNRDCILETVGDEAKIIARDVGKVIAKRLDKLSPSKSVDASDMVDPAPLKAKSKSELKTAKEIDGCVGLPTSYTIILSGFENDQVDMIENLLMNFKGYKSHRPLRSQELYAEYFYETCSERARLQRNMRALADQLEGENKVTLTANKIELEHIAEPATR